MIVPQERPLMTHVKKTAPHQQSPFRIPRVKSSLSATFADSPFLNGRNDNGCTSISIGTLRYLQSPSHEAPLGKRDELSYMYLYEAGIIQADNFFDMCTRPTTSDTE